MTMLPFSRIILASLIELFPIAVPIFYLIFKRRKYSLRTTLCALALFIVNLAVACTLTSSHWIHYGYIRLIFSVCAITVFVLLLIFLMDEKPDICAFLCLYINSYADLCVLCARLIFIFVFHTSSKYVMASAMGLIISTSVSLVTLPLCLYSLRKILACVDRTRRFPFWRYLWVIPGAFFLMFRFAVYPNYLINSVAPGNDLLAFSLVYSLCIFLGYFFLIRLMNILVGYHDIYESLESIVALQNKSYLVLQNNMESIHTARHDLRHHLIVIDRYAREGDLCRLREYIRPLMSSSALNETLLYCENPAVDAVFSYFSSMAQSRGILFKHSIKLPAALPVRDLDLCTILGNLLENAVEACERQASKDKYIQVKMAVAGTSAVTICVENTYGEKIVQKGNSFLSTKHPGIGIGTSSVRHLADRYMGVVKYEYTDHVFRASILLNSAEEEMKKS